MALENTHYDAIYDMVIGNAKQGDESGDVEKTRLHNTNKKRIFLNSHNLDVVTGEDPSIFHKVRAMKRQDTHMIPSIRYCNGIIHTGSVGILKSFADFIQQKYSAIPVDDESFERLASIIHHTHYQRARMMCWMPLLN
jgi:hypothetical protein